MWHCHSSVALQLSSADCNSARFHEDRHCAMCAFFAQHHISLTSLPFQRQNVTARKSFFLSIQIPSPPPRSVQSSYSCALARSLLNLELLFFSRILLLAVRSFAVRSSLSFRLFFSKLVVPSQLPVILQKCSPPNTTLPPIELFRNVSVK